MVWVPDLSPRETKGILSGAAIFLKASRADLMPLTFRGSSVGPLMTTLADFNGGVGAYGHDINLDAGLFSENWQ